MNHACEALGGLAQVVGTACGHKKTALGAATPKAAYAKKAHIWFPDAY